jgi:hypothetical protein
MTVSRSGFHTKYGRHPTRGSHVSGKSANTFARKIKDNLDAQCKRLEKELCKTKETR